MIKAKPKFPIKVTFRSDGQQLKFDNAPEAACTLKWFDSQDREENVQVTDSLGRHVILTVVKLEIMQCCLA